MLCVILDMQNELYVLTVYRLIETEMDDETKVNPLPTVGTFGKLTRPK